MQTYHTKINPSGIDMSVKGNNIILDVAISKVGSEYKYI